MNHLSVADKQNFQFSTLDQSILSALEALSQVSANCGYPIRPYTKKALSQLHVAPVDKKENILAQLKTISSILSHYDETEKQAPSDKHPEKELIERALNFYKLKLKDENFWKVIGHDEVIEIYNVENLQIFRTFNFYKITSYSLLDFLVNEWYHLWQRPSSVLEQLMKLSASLCTGQVSQLSECGVPDHVYKEIYNNEDKTEFISRSSLCKFGHICPIYEEDGRIGGFLISAQVTPISFGEETKGISFI